MGTVLLTVPYIFLKLFHTSFPISKHYNSIVTNHNIHTYNPICMALKYYCPITITHKFHAYHPICMALKYHCPIAITPNFSCIPPYLHSIKIPLQSLGFNQGPLKIHGSSVWFVFWAQDGRCGGEMHCPSGGDHTRCPR